MVFHWLQLLTMVSPVLQLKTMVYPWHLLSQPPMLLQSLKHPTNLPVPSPPLSTLTSLPMLLNHPTLLLLSAPPMLQWKLQLSHTEFPWLIQFQLINLRKSMECH